MTNQFKIKSKKAPFSVRIPESLIQRISDVRANASTLELDWNLSDVLANAIEREIENAERELEKYREQ